MASRSHTFRVFVSSTFMDLKAERNALAVHVFPALRRLCERHNCTFQAVDLRWGIATEASLDQQTMNICLEELHRCRRLSPRPNFIILLGDRYGWQPLPAQIPADEFGSLAAASPRDWEHLEEWYKRDDNAVPPNYCLQPRTGAWEDDNAWSKAEADLVGILRQAASRLGWSEDDDRWLHYFGSATHQEILNGALKIEDAQEHVFAFFRRISAPPPPDMATTFIDPEQNGSSPQSEGETTRLSQLDRLKRALRARLGPNVLERYEARWASGGTPVFPADSSCRAIIDKLCDMLREGEIKSGGARLAEEEWGRIAALSEQEVSRAGWGAVSGALHPVDSPITLDHLPRLCADVYLSLARVILGEIAQISDCGPLESDIDAHRQFEDERAKLFIGRPDALRRIVEYCLPRDRASSGRRSEPLVLHGVSGSGKSALMARAACDVRKENPAPELFVRFVGATASSSNLASLLQGLCREIYERLGFEEARRAALAEIAVQEQSTDEDVKANARKGREEIERTYAIPNQKVRLAETFRRFLTMIPAERPAAVMLDALDQLISTDEPCDLYWFPTELPEHVRLVVSTVPGNWLEALRRQRLSKNSFLSVTAMSAGEGEGLLDAWMRQDSRTLQPAQREDILTKFSTPQNGLPLYLKLAYGEARRWKSYDSLPVRADGARGLGADIPGILQDMFARLEEPRNHGSALVRHALGYLAASRTGLTESEMIDLLSSNAEVITDVQRRSPASGLLRQLPVAVWVRLRGDMEPYLTEREYEGDAVLSFYHRQVAESSAHRYLTGGDAIRLHKALGRYFRGLADPGNDCRWNGDRGRPFLQVVFHLATCKEVEEACDTLCDLSFVAARCRYGQIFPLQTDYELALCALPEARSENDAEAARNAELSRWGRELTDFSREWNRRFGRRSTGAYSAGTSPFVPSNPRSSRPWTDEEILAARRQALESPTRQDRVRAFAQFVSSQSDPLMHHGRSRTFVLQHAFNYDQSGPVHAAAASLLSEETAPYLVRYRPASELSNFDPALKQSLFGHTSYVSSLSVASDGCRAVSGSWDGTVRLWDLRAGRCLNTLQFRSVQSVSLASDGNRCAIADHGIVEVWDLETSQRVASMGKLRGSCVCLTPDGQRIASPDYENRIQVWDLESGECLAALEGHSGEINSVSITADGRTVVSGSVDRTVRLWNLETSERLVLEGHGKSVLSVAVTPDGRRIVSASYDCSIRLWDLPSGQCLQTLQDCNIGLGQDLSVSLTPDGKVAVSGGMDKKFRVWDLEAGTCLRTLHGHTGWIRCVSITADGRLALSGGTEGIVRIWNIEKGMDIEIFEPARTISVAPDGNSMLTGGDDTVRVWDPASGKCLHVMHAHANGVRRVSVTPDGIHGVSGDNNGLVQMWELRTGACIWKRFWQYIPWGGEMMTSDGLLGICETSMGFVLGMVRVWQLSTGTRGRWLVGHEGEIKGSTISRDGRYIVTGSNDRTMRAWSPRTRVCRWQVKVADGKSHVLVTPDNRRVLSSNGVWDLESGTRLLESGVSEIFSITEDSRRVVAADGQTLLIRDVETGDCLHTLQGHAGSITCVAVTMDGRWILSGGSDRTVRVWDMEAGECMAVLEAGEPVTEVKTFFGNRAVVGIAGGVWFLQLRNLCEGAAVGVYGSTGGRQPASARCPVCRAAFTIAAKAAPPLQPDAAGPVRESVGWADTHVETDCPHCSRPLSLIDNSDAAYAASLRRGLEHSRRTADANTRSHLIALANILKMVGKRKEAFDMLREARGLPMDFSEHVAEFARCIIPFMVWWILATVGAWFSHRQISFPGLLSWEIDGLAVSYPLLCFGIWRFIGRALRKKEVLLFIGSVLCLPAVVLGVAAVCQPIEWLWMNVLPSRYAGTPWIFAKAVLMLPAAFPAVSRYSLDEGDEWEVPRNGILRFSPIATLLVLTGILLAPAFAFAALLPAAHALALALATSLRSRVRKYYWAVISLVWGHWLERACMTEGDE